MTWGRLHQDSVVKKFFTTAADGKKNLNEDEIDRLNRIVVMWLDFAEDQAQRRKQVFMKDWEIKLDEFLKFNERNVLQGAGSVGKKTADAHARDAYDRFAERRRKHKKLTGHEESIKQLEDTARQLSEKNGKS